MVLALKLKWARTRLEVISALSFSKAFWQSLVHSKLASFLNRIRSGVVISAKLGTNFKLYAAVLRNECTSFVFEGGSICSSASMLDWSGLTPSLEIWCPAKSISGNRIGIFQHSLWRCTL